MPNCHNLSVLKRLCGAGLLVAGCLSVAVAATPKAPILSIDGVPTEIVDVVDPSVVTPPGNDWGSQRGTGLAGGANTSWNAEVTVYSTIYSIGYEWGLTGDSDHDAKITATYRKAGSPSWLRAAPAARVDTYWAGSANGGNFNHVAGSLLRLEPNTTYEINLAASDPDGGSATKRFTFRTYGVPQRPTGPIKNATPATFASVYATAQPGDRIMLAGGVYNSLGSNLQINRSGTGAHNAHEDSINRIGLIAADPANPPVFNRIDLSANNVYFEGITFRGQGTGYNPGQDYAAYAGIRTMGEARNIVVSHCLFEYNLYSIWMAGGRTDRWYIADNTIIGNKIPGSTASEGVFNDDATSYVGEGIELWGSWNHTIAHNTITQTADAISYPGRNVDVFGNDIYSNADDFMEGDAGGVGAGSQGQQNVRVWGNRGTVIGHNLWSFQTQRGGPQYAFYNQIIGFKQSMFKLGGSGPNAFMNYHNTTVKASYPSSAYLYAGNTYFTTGAFQIYHGDRVNNADLFYPLQNNVYKVWDTNLSRPGERPWPWTRQVNNAYQSVSLNGGGDKYPWGLNGVYYQTIANLRTALAAAGYPGQDDRSIELANAANDFEAWITPCVNCAAVLTQLIPRSGSSLIDAGVTIPGVTATFAGAAPDIGAYDRGQPWSPAYGPREQSDDCGSCGWKWGFAGNAAPAP